MSWTVIAQTLVTLAAGGGIAEGGATFRDMRTRRREGRAAHDRFQRETIVLLQDAVEAWMAAVAPLLARKDPGEDLFTALGRIMALTSRMENQELAGEVRAWARELREALEGRPDRPTFEQLRDRRIELIDQLGVELGRWKP